jgi:hypothetical protein
MSKREDDIVPSGFRRDACQDNASDSEGQAENHQHFDSLHKLEKRSPHTWKSKRPEGGK